MLRNTSDGNELALPATNAYKKGVTCQLSANAFSVLVTTTPVAALAYSGSPWISRLTPIDAPLKLAVAFIVLVASVGFSSCLVVGYVANKRVGMDWELGGVYQ